jgi:hypothetical protein
VVRKVWIERFNHIPSTIELAGKITKIDDKRKTCMQQSMEALACSCEHPGVIKFLTIYIKTVEAYTLCWNGGTLQKMLDYNTKYSPIMNNCTLLWQGGLNMKGRTWLVTFRQNHVKLAWAFINIMRAIHHCGILHNDLFKDYIMLHFPTNKLNVVYIGMCDWALVRGNAIIVWVCKGVRCNQCKKNVLVGAL